MENGSIFTLIIAPSYYSGDYYNPSTYAAYFPTTEEYGLLEFSHAVSIIGWDDNFSRDNFIEENKPEHDGAYIVLNSWGKDFGDNGIYYISYDDAFVEQNLRGIKEAVTDISELKSTTSFTIKDKNLYNALKNALGRKIISFDDSINQITMLNGIINQITYMDLNDYNISDLTGIENFTNLYSLNLSHNNLSNIKPLLSLHNLETLDLRYNQFTEIPIELKNAELYSLSIGYNSIADFSRLADISSVSYLNLEGTSIKDKDLIYLKNLKITNLNLSKTYIKDYSTLKTLNDELEEEIEPLELCISYNEDILYSSIPNVSYLNVSHTNIDENKFKQIDDLSNLISLDISYTNIKDLSFLSDMYLRDISISGNRDLENFDAIQSIGYIDYEDAGLKDISIFQGFYSTNLSLAQNEIEDYEALLDNEYLRFIDLTNNKIRYTYYSENVTVALDGNNIKPTDYCYECIDSIKNQTYVETLTVDVRRENIFDDIGFNLKMLSDSGVKLDINNATIDYKNKIFKVNDYDKDVVIKIENGIYEGSTITYKIKKVEDTIINYIYIDSTDIKTTYIEGEDFDISTLKVYARYSNNSLSKIEDFTVKGEKNLQVGENSIIVEKDGLEDYIDVNVIPKN